MNLNHELFTSSLPDIEVQIFNPAMVLESMSVNTKTLVQLCNSYCDKASLSAWQNLDISGLSLDSRKIQPGDLFFATAGGNVDGRHYIKEAIKNGAVAVCVEPNDQWLSGCITILMNTPLVAIENLTQKMGEIAACFYDYPSKYLDVIGITGTNGKTSCSHFLAQTLYQLGKPCGVSGTLGFGVYKSDFQQLEQFDNDSPQTTPDSISLQKILSQLKKELSIDDEVMSVAMEVSSHALDQERVHGVKFSSALFTNITHDHLDYHFDMKQYAQAKKSLFFQTGLETAVINYDDEIGRQWLTEMPEGLVVYSYSVDKAEADVFAQDAQFNSQGISATVVTPWGEINLISPLLGKFNLSNLLAVLTILGAKGYELNQLSESLAKVTNVEGRMQCFGGHQQPLVIIDYAHTPDALDNVLTALREHCKGKLWCVFGCGGNRDQGKRRLMGEIAQRLSDHVVITNDNPRHESSEEIIADILSGMKRKSTFAENILVEKDRAAAIAKVIQQAVADDIVLVAGKGHESYQDISGKKITFLDKDEVIKVLKQHSVKNI